MLERVLLINNIIVTVYTDLLSGSITPTSNMARPMTPVQSTTAGAHAGTIA